MNDLDDRLRADLAQLSTTFLDLGVSTRDVIQRGQRVRRSRITRRTVGAVSVAVVTAVLAWSTPWPLSTSLAPIVPAAPTVRAAAGAGTAYFNLTDIGLGDDFQRFEVDALPAGTGWDITTSQLDRHGVVTAQRVLHQSAAPQTITLAPRVVLELIPSRVNWCNVVTARTTQLTYVDWSHFGELGLTAMLLVFDGATPPGEPAGFIWAGPDGTIRNSLGDVLPTADIDLKSRTVTVYWDKALDQFGYQSATGDYGPVADMSRPGFGPHFIGIAGDGRGNLTQFAADLLPAGAKDVRIVLRSGEAEWAAADLAGRIAYVVAYPLALKEQPIRSIAYTDRAGRQVMLDMP
jgi:hypothetical protein